MNERLKHNDRDFRSAFEGIQFQAHQIAESKGWWEEPRSDAECIALMHSELSEALEGLRTGNPESEKLPNLGFTQAEEEMADLVIRVMDWAESRKFRIAAAILAKLDYNMTRPHKHGKKF